MNDVRPLTDLLGDTRAQIVTALQQGPLAAGDVADRLGISTAAVRRHLNVLCGDDLVSSETVRDGSMGRPHEHWSLTARAKRLFADRSAEFADEVLDHLEENFGRQAVVEFLKARAERHGDRYADRLAALDDPADRARALAGALSDDGFAARVVDGDDGRSLTLLQSHCAIEGIATEHPEVCAHEAALFKRLLGADDRTVKVSRRDTIASGAQACVCHIELPDIELPDDQTQTDRTPTSDRSA